MSPYPPLRIYNSPWISRIHWLFRAFCANLHKFAGVLFPSLISAILDGMKRSKHPPPPASRVLPDESGLPEIPQEWKE